MYKTFTQKIEDFDNMDRLDEKLNYYCAQNNYEVVSHSHYTKVEGSGFSERVTVDFREFILVRIEDPRGL